MSIAEVPQINNYKEQISATTDIGIEYLSGVEWRYVSVDDLYTDDYMPEAVKLRQTMALWTQELRTDDLLRTGPEIIDGYMQHYNHISRTVYSHPAMYSWRTELVPSALALWPLQRPLDAKLPNGVDIDQRSREFFLHSRDAIGMRSRAAIFGERGALALNAVSPDRRARWVSAASGAAVPVVDALTHTSFSGEIDVDLIDIDSKAHDMAAALIQEANFTNISFTSHNEDVLRGLIVTDRLIDKLGARQQADVVDALGIFEYVGNPKKASAFASNLYELVRPGGSLILGNMLDTHPDLEFNRYGIGWPGIYPRSREEIVDILASAGLPAEATTAYVPEDGVYAVIEVRKPVDA